MKTTDKKPYALERPTRSTGMGAYDDSQLFSITQKKELKPHRRKYSRTGNHGKKIWFLLPGVYYLYSETRSNSGKGGPALHLLQIHDDGEVQKKSVPEPPDWLKTELGDEVINTLYPTPYS